jgi:hypothetical protein
MHETASSLHSVEQGSSVGYCRTKGEGIRQAVIRHTLERGKTYSFPAPLAHIVISVPVNPYPLMVFERLEVEGSEARV